MPILFYLIFYLYDFNHVLYKNASFISHYAFESILMLEGKKYTVRIRVWIDEESGPFLGIGRVILLEKIKETGSITNAAKAIKMSYRQAWQLVEDMNKRANVPLVEKILGGKHGSGTVLTAAGEQAIKEFYTLEKEIKKSVEDVSKKMKF